MNCIFNTAPVKAMGKHSGKFVLLSTSPEAGRRSFPKFCTIRKKRPAKPPAEEHSHLGCGAGGHPACRGKLSTRRDARLPHRQDACATGQRAQLFNRARWGSRIVRGSTLREAQCYSGCPVRTSPLRSHHNTRKSGISESTKKSGPPRRWMRL